MATRLEERERRRQDRIAQEQAQAGYPPRKPPGTRNALGDNDPIFPGFQWIERNFGRMFAVSMVLSVIFTLAIVALIVALIFHLT